MIVEKMVIRYKDKTLLKGCTSDFSQEKREFHLKSQNGTVVKVDVEKLKAAFIVKTFEGNKHYRSTYQDPILWGGKKVKVEFADGEVMIGYIPCFLNGSQNFLVTPADVKCNNKEVFVVSSATRNITYM